VLYFSQTSPARLALRRVARGSAVWGPAVPVTPVGAAVNASVPALALDADDAPLIFYRQDSARSPIMRTTCR
jgi:hypothetical protein